MRLLAHEVADLFFSEVAELASRNGWVSNDHFSVDSTLIEACASLKSFRPKGTDQGPGGGNGRTDFKCETRSNATHESTTDEEAELVRKGPETEARLSFAGHVIMESRHGLCVLFEVHPAVGAPELQVAVEQAVELRNRGFKQKSNGGDKGYHTAEFVTGMREFGIVPASRAEGRTEDAAGRVRRGARSQSESAQTHRGDFRADEDHRMVLQESLLRGRAHPRAGPIRRGHV